MEFRREQQEGNIGAAPVTAMRSKAGRYASHGGEAAVHRATTNIRRKAAVRQWDEHHGKLIDLSAFAREILPLIQEEPLSRLQRATGLSLRYVSQIRRGE